jgi:hypothetical protein
MSRVLPVVDRRQQGHVQRVLSHELSRHVLTRRPRQGPHQRARARMLYSSLDR